MKRIMFLLMALSMLVVACAESVEPVDLKDPFLGPEDAEIVVVEYSDFECPFCGAAMGTNQGLINQFKAQDPTWEPAVPKLKELAEAGEIKLVFKHFPLTNIHKYALGAAEAAEAANAQGMFWEYHDVLFLNQERLTEAKLIDYAEQVGLDVEKFKTELKGNAYEASVRKDYADGIRVGVSGTPAFLVNGKLIEGAVPFSVLEAEIEALKQ